jgi:hypothetical protein
MSKPQNAKSSLRSRSCGPSARSPRGHGGETHSGEHASIIDRPTFDAIQAKLADNVRSRRISVESSPAV